MAIAGVPGLSIGIINQGKVAGTYHFGYRDIGAGVRPNDQTRYNINSLTKGILSALVGIEIFNDHTRLNWHDPIRTWLPDFDAYTAEIGGNSNIVDLLSHRSGVSGVDDLWMGADNVIYLPKSEACRTFASLQGTKPFRTSFEYNNWGFEIVGQVLETLCGQSIGQLMHDHVFAPLGMKRTSTAWDPSDCNEAKSYGILRDFTRVEVSPPQLGNGTIMEAAGGVKSTLEDMLIFYQIFLREVNAQYKLNVDSTGLSPLKFCRMLTTNHARLPGMSLREQGYGLGWVRSQLPGQLGRISANAAIRDEPVVGNGGPSRLVLYNHGCMPGSTSAVILVPELELGIVVLQNSLPAIDTADFIAQMLLETLLEVPEPNDYVKLAREFNRLATGHIDDLQKELERNQILGTRPRPLTSYQGRFWNPLRNFFIEVLESEENQLFMKFQGMDSQSYKMEHYHYNTFSWLMPYDEVVRRDRGVQFYSAEYYLIEFRSNVQNGGLDQLLWVMDGNFTGEKVAFTNDSTESDASVRKMVLNSLR
jgi:CubicO group peptidase (beta-lactamase class C family)